MTKSTELIVAAVLGLASGIAIGYLAVKYGGKHEEEVSVEDNVTRTCRDAVDHLIDVANQLTSDEVAREADAYEVDEIGVSREHLDPDHIPYEKGVRVIGDAEFASLCTSEDVETLELVYFAEDGMISEEGDIFSTISETEAKSMLGDTAWDIVVDGGFDEVHFYNDHEYKLYTVTRYDGAWGDMAAYAAGSGR